MHGVMSGDIKKESVLYQAISAAVLTAYRVRNHNAPWEDHASLYMLTETAQNLFGESCVHLLRGKGEHSTDESPEVKNAPESPRAFFNAYNLYLPSPRTIQRGVPAGAATDGMYALDVVNYIIAAKRMSKTVVKNDNVVTIMGCVAIDGMVIKPSLGLSVATNPPVGNVVGLADTPLSYEDIVELEAMPDDAIRKFLNSKKWIDSANEVHFTTLDAALSDTLGCFMKAKGGNKANFENFVRQCITDISKCVHCLTSSLKGDTNCMASTVRCDAYCRFCMEAGQLCMKHANSLSRGHWHYAKVRCSNCVASGCECVKLGVLGLAVDCEAQQAATLRNLRADFNGRLAALPDPGHGGKGERNTLDHYWVRLPCGHYANMKVLMALRDDPDRAVRKKMEKAVTKACLKIKDQHSVETLVELVAEPLIAALPDGFVVVTMVPELYQKHWASNLPGVIKRPSAILFDEQCSLIFVADSALNKLKVVDMHAPSNVLDVILRSSENAKLNNCKGMTKLGVFLILIVDGETTNFNLIALNAQQLISRSQKANAEASDGAEVAPQSNYQKRGVKTKAKVAQLFGLELVSQPASLPQLRSPFAIVADGKESVAYITDVDLNLVFCLSHIKFEEHQAVLSKCCQVEKPHGIALAGDYLFIVDGNAKTVKVFDKSLNQFLQDIAVVDAHSPHSLMICNEHLWVTDYGANKLLRMELSTKLWEVVIAGDATKQKPQDGVASSATLYQPTMMAAAGSSLIVADSGNGAVRIVTQPRSLVPLFQKMQEYLASFGIPMQDSVLSVDRCKAAIKGLSEFLELMAKKNGERSTFGLNGEGYDGNFSNTNRRQLQWMLDDGLAVIEKELTLLDHTHLIKEVNPSALQEVVCEHFFSLMHKWMHMPSQIEYHDHRAKVLLENQKKRAFRSWHYFTGPKAQHYLMDAAGAMEISMEARRKKWQRRGKVQDVDEWELVRSKRSTMTSFSTDWGSGVRQSSVRARTMEPCGTVPLSVSHVANGAAIVQNEAPLHTSRSVPPGHSDGPEHESCNRKWSVVRFKAGDFLGFKPHISERKKFGASDVVWSDVIWYGRLTEDVLRVYERKPKSLGSTKFRTTSANWDAHLRLRWLAVTDHPHPGYLYEWEDGDFGGEGIVDTQCKTSSIVCRVEFEEDIHANGVVYYHLSQEEADRAKDRIAVDSSDATDSDGSSDGVPEDLQPDSMHKE